MVKVTVKLDSSKINRLVDTSKQAFKLTVEDTLKAIKDWQVVPKDTGKLENSGTIEFINEFVASIVFDTPYARRLYWHPEYRFNNLKNANAQGKWMQSFIDGADKDFIKETYSKHFKELSKGLIT